MANRGACVNGYFGVVFSTGRIWLSRASGRMANGGIRDMAHASKIPELELAVWRRATRGERWWR
eukprot:scaffold23399_cov135-Isochrysis_galbana.AAC.2